MTSSRLVPNAAISKNQTSHTITQNSEHNTAVLKRNKLITLICLLIMALLALIMVGGFLATPFFAAGMYIGMAALASLLISMVVFPLVISYLPQPSTHVRPRDLDLSKLDVRHNRLLHEIIKEDEKKYAQEQEVKQQRRQRRSLRSLPQRRPVEVSSSDEAPKPRRKTSSVLNLMRPRSSSSASSHSSSHDSDSSSGEHQTQQPMVVTRPVFPKKYENYMHCID
ncbi:serine rich exported protein [Chlamydia abortus]|uniref:Serine rich exported protein n=1 Tax=Chlamydia abortus (strain DSM 27085 / S26/3) TaxID=218497 RepID=Q5L6G1_CHLAB|nr:IncA family protein [Chlamydia abortus]CAH63764.1 putative serine rich exported protein [Chlamydia abortus S26/3]SGW48650.1 serine rich exported protein [Chlamydia abortus]